MTDIKINKATGLIFLSISAIVFLIFIACEQVEKTEIKVGANMKEIAAVSNNVVASEPFTAAGASAYSPACPFRQKEGRIIVYFKKGTDTYYPGVRWNGTDQYAKNQSILLTSNPNKPIPAGTYQVTLFSFDGYSGRGEQKYEKWFAELKLKDGQTIRTGVSEDLPDNVDNAKIETIVNPQYDEQGKMTNDYLKIPSEVKEVWQYHYFLMTPPPAGYQLTGESVQTRCMVFDKVEDPYGLEGFPFFKLKER